MSLAPTLQSSLKEDFLLLSCALVFYLCTFLSGLEVFFFSTPPSRLGAEYPWAEGKAGKPLESEGGAALLLASEAWAHHSLAACRGETAEWLRRWLAEAEHSGHGLGCLQSFCFPRSEEYLSVKGEKKSRLPV